MDRNEWAFVKERFNLTKKEIMRMDRKELIVLENKASELFFTLLTDDEEFENFETCAAENFYEYVWGAVSHKEDEEFQRFLRTLDEKTLFLVRDWMKKHEEEFNQKTPHESMETLIRALCWHLKNKAEFAETPSEARKIEKYKTDLYNVWKREGFTD